MIQIKKFTPKEHKLKALLYGKSGSGKTTLASTSPNPLFICSENGLASIADKAPDYVEVSSVEGLKQIYFELKKGLDYDTIVIDSLSEIARVIKEELTQGNKYDMDMRKRGKYAEEMMQIIRDIIRLPYHVVCVIHDKTISDDDGTIKAYDIAIQGSAREEIPRYFDVITYTFIKEGEHRASCKPSERFITKDRLKCLPEVLPLDISEWISLFEKSVKIGKEKVVKEISDDPLLKSKEFIQKAIAEGEDPTKAIQESKKLTDDQKVELLNFIAEERG